MTQYIVYKLTSPSNKHYIGWTKRSLKKRLHDHQFEAKKKNILKIHKAINKYKLINFKQEIVFETNDLVLSLQKEKEFIQKFDSIQNGYNISSGGDKGALGCIRSKQYKQLHSQLAKQRHKDGIYNTKKYKIDRHLVRIGTHQPQSQKDAVAKALSASWQITDPTGKQFIISNLSKWCKTIPTLKTSQANLCKYGHAKGYKCEKVNETG